jgi:hypothetical protein
MGWWRSWIKKFVSKHYRDAEAMVGDMESYWCMGEAIGYRQARNNLAFWKRLARKHKIPLIKDRVAFGGYGIEEDTRND